MTAESDSVVKLVIFDCDGTLVDSQHGIVASMVDAFRAEGLVAPVRASILGVVGLSLEIAIARLVPAGSDLDRVDRMSEAYKEAFRARRLRKDHAEPLYEGMRETVEALAARDDVLLGIATGKSRRGLDAVLEREGLARHFATLQTADTNPSKPDPAMILTAMEEASVGPGNTVMIGDTTFDIDMALEAGVLPVGVGWGYHPPEDLRAAGASFVAANHRDLDAALDRFLSPISS
jgi:phosphoglycolate phosphatase